MRRTTLNSPASKSTQRRGDERRRLLLQATHTLLQTLEFRELTFVAVCERAGIPHGSARHFYPDLDALLQGLLGELGRRHDAALAEPLPRSAKRSWRALVHTMIERSFQFQERNPVFAKLTIGGYMPPQLKRLDRDADYDRAHFLLTQLDTYFVLPRLRDSERVAYYATEIIDTAFMLSMRENNHIAPWWVKRAKEAATSVLAQHFGELMPRPLRRD